MTINDFLSRLEGVKGHGSQYAARCPAHDDKHQSLSVTSGRDGQILVNCHAGCKPEHIVSAMALTMNDLFPDKQAEPTNELTWKEVDTYPYIDLDGKFAEKVRKESNTGKKSFLWRQPDGKGGWKYNRQGIGHVLYNWAALENERAAFVVEGEKDVNALAQRGKIAVCGADGAGPGKWKPEYTEQLRGIHVAIIPDNDCVGKEFAIETAAALHGVAASVRMLDLSTIWPELPEHGDVSDLIIHIGNNAADAITKLANETPEYVPGLVIHDAKPTEPTQPTQPSTNPGPPELEKIAASDLMKKEFPPLIQAVNQLVCEGLTVLVAASKIGKSWLVLLMAVCVALGEPFLGRATTKCRVIYFALEDSERRLQSRLQKMEITSIPENLEFVTKAQMIDSGFLSQVESWLKADEGPALVIVDTLQKVRGVAKKGINTYEGDYDVVGGIKALADKYRAMIVCVHHTNKAKNVTDIFDKVSGSMGIMGAADTTILIDRERGQDTATVHFEGRDAWGDDFVIRQEDNCRWELMHSNLLEFKAGVEYEEEPLVQLFRHLITEKPEGGRWAYSKLQAIGLELLGYQPFIDGKDCARKLNDGLANELRGRDKIIVETAVQTTGGKGIRLQQISPIIAFPTKMQIDDEEPT